MIKNKNSFIFFLFNVLYESLEAIVKANSESRIFPRRNYSYQWGQSNALTYHCVFVLVNLSSLIP